MRFTALFVACFVLPTFATAEDYSVGNLSVAHPVARETPPSARAGAGYMTITNTGDAADRLIAVEANYPRVEIHDVKVENDVASMFKIDGVEIAPGESITLRPGQRHVMFMGLDGDPFEAGEEIPATLVFENAGSVDIVFEVMSGDALTETLGIEAGHSGHGSHGGHGTHGSNEKSDDHSTH